jgi:hypothetical protein
MMERFVSLLGDVDKMKELKAKTGIDVKGKAPEQIINEMATNTKLNKAGMMQDIFGSDILGRKMIGALTTARKRVLGGQPGAIDIGAIAGVDAQAGRAGVAGGMQTLSGEGFFKLQIEAASLQADAVTNLESYNQQVLAVLEVSSRLELAFGSLSLWAESIAAIGVVGALANFVKNFSGGPPGSNVPGSVPMPGMPKGKMPPLMKAARAAGYVGMAISAYELGEYGFNYADDLVKEKTGKSVSERMFGHQSPAENDAYKTRMLAANGGGMTVIPSSSTPAPTTGSSGNESLLGAIGKMNRDVTRSLEQIDNGLRANTVKPAAPAPREPR